METVDVFAALADPTRRRLLELLAGGERTASRLAEPFPISRPAVSQHLDLLRRAGLVARRRAGRCRWYRLRPERLARVARWVRHRVAAPRDASLDDLREHLWKNQ